MVHIAYLTLLLIVTTEQSLTCSRLYSKSARDILRDIGFFDLLEANTPLDTCTLSLSKDVYRHQEAQKSFSHANHWLCGFCGKAFKTEQYLDKHFDLKHNDKKDNDNASSCMGDHCEWLRCEILNRWYEPNYWDRALCNHQEIASLRVLCINALAECFDDEEVLNTSIIMLCDTLNCNEYYIDDRETIGSYLLQAGKLFMFILTCFVVCFLYLVIIPLVTMFLKPSTTTDKKEKQKIKPK